MAKFSMKAAELQKKMCCARCGETFEGTKSQAIHELYDKRPAYCSNRCRKKPTAPKGHCKKCGLSDRYVGGDCRACAMAFREAHKDRLNAATKTWRDKNPDKAKQSCLSWRDRNMEKQKTTTAAWKKANPVKRRMHEAKRRAAKIGSTPAWVNQFLIEEICDLAVKRSAATGFEWHVDHIVPLQSSIVCGLHWERNLQVIPAKANIAKRNRHWPDMP